MGYWARAELTYGVNLPTNINADWHENDAPEEAATKTIREFAPGNTCGVIRLPDGVLRLTAKYWQANDGRGGAPQEIQPHELGIWPSTNDDLFEAATALGVNPDNFKPAWLLTASAV